MIKILASFISGALISASFFHLFGTNQSYIMPNVQWYQDKGSLGAVATGTYEHIEKKNWDLMRDGMYCVHKVSYERMLRTNKSICERPGAHCQSDSSYPAHIQVAIDQELRRLYVSEMKSRGEPVDEEKIMQVDYSKVGYFSDFCLFNHGLCWISGSSFGYESDRHTPPTPYEEEKFLHATGGIKVEFVSKKREGLLGKLLDFLDGGKTERKETRPDGKTDGLAKTDFFK